MATVTLTPRQQEIEKLLKEGKTAPQIAKKLKISDNAVYQQLRKIREARGGKAPKASARKATAKKSGRKSGAKPARQRAVAPPAPSPVPQAASPVEPKLPTLLQHARAEVKAAEDAMKEQAREIEAAEKAIVQAKGKIEELTVERDRKQDLVAVLTGEKRAVNIPTPKAKPEAPAPAAAKPAKEAGETAEAPAAPQSAPSAPESGTNGTAPVEPSTQAEREATGEHDGTGAPVAA